MVNGSVTISIEDFQALLDVKIKTAKVEGNLKIAIKELQVFLSFICNRSNISVYVDEFNRQSQTSQIIIEDGKAKIKINEKD